MAGSHALLTLLVAALCLEVRAQSYTSCDPLEKTTCSANTGSTQTSMSYDFTQSSALDDWTTSAGTVVTGTDGLEFTINSKGDSPTIQTDFYIFFGEVTIRMKAAPGTGIVSSLILESDDLDEIDWEALGGYTTKLQTDYYGKGDSADYDRWTWVSVSSPQTTFHTYKWTWSETALTWSVDGNTVRTLAYADAVNGTRYPQSPMRVRLGIWAGGDSDNNSGTIEWAGGQTDYSAGPFTMYVSSVDIVNYNPAQSYTYTDQTGSYGSIQITGSDGTTSSLTGTTTSTSTDTASTPSGSSSLWNPIDWSSYSSAGTRCSARWGSSLRGAVTLGTHCITLLLLASVFVFSAGQSI
ncbi:concanavalin A-like lectin/glucanase domain-containing protein [Aspergillus oleicola]